MAEQRKYPRRQVARIPVEIGGTRAGHVEDVSLGGAFIRDHSHPEPSGLLRVLPHRSRPVERRCHVVRRDAPPVPRWCCVEFDEPLTEYELSVIEHGEHGAVPADCRGTYELAKQDRDVVSGEIREIKTCQTHIFLSTVGSVTTATLAIWTLGIQGVLGEAGSLTAIGIIFMALHIGIICAIQKSRSVTFREGFLAALDDGLARQMGPLHYLGWTQTRQCLSECGTIRRVDACPRRIPSVGSAACQDEGEAAAALGNAGKRVFPGVLDSFMSLSVAVNAGLYAAVFCLFSWFLARYWRAQFSVNAAATASLIAGGFLVSAFVARFRKLVVGVIAGGAITVLLGVTLRKNALLLCAAIMLGAFVGSLSWFFLRQYWDTRLGRRSVETWKHTWRKVLQHCSPLAPTGGRFPNVQWAHKLCLWLLDREGHSQTAERVRSQCTETRV